MDDLKTVAAEVRVCKLCGLAATRKNAEVMLIGEGPGFNEDQQGRPFVGPSGQFLTELLASAGFKRSEVFIANVVKCRPPQNRDPLPEEIGACRAYLDRQIALIDPKIIITLGRFSMARWFPNERISAIHGHAKNTEGRIVVAMYHPAAALHQPALRQTLEDDFKRLRDILAEAQKKGEPPATAQPEEKSGGAEQLSLF
jgi:uracil-DNA glycosylase family 4